jgi:peptidoglycan/LPS O-acetylase OafA/YrhL
MTHDAHPRRRAPSGGSPGTPYTGPDRRAVPNPTGLERGRNSGLDGLRAFAAVFVVLFHLHTVNGISFGPLDPVIRGGDSGVYLFFALSGYLLYKPFVRGPVDLVGYALKRSGRVVPGYYVALVGLAFLTGSLVPVLSPLPFLTISASYDLELRGFLGNAWTLTAEIIFYLGLPLIARLVRGREAAVLTALGGTSVALAVLHRAAMTPDNAWLVGTFPLVFYAFVPGMLLAVLEVRHPIRFRSLRRAPYGALGVTLIALGAMTSTFYPVALVTGVGTVLVMGWLVHQPVPGARALAFAGGASYALYLWHKDTIVAFGPGVGLGVALLAAMVSWALIERPILRRVHAIAANHAQRRLGAQTASATAY